MSCLNSLFSLNSSPAFQFTEAEEFRLQLLEAEGYQIVAAGIVNWLDDYHNGYLRFTQQLPGETLVVFGDDTAELKDLWRNLDNLEADLEVAGISPKEAFYFYTAGEDKRISFSIFYRY